MIQLAHEACWKSILFLYLILEILSGFLIYSLIKLDLSDMELSVPNTRGVKGKGSATEYCVETIVSGRRTQTWLRYSELRQLSQLLKTVKGERE